MIEYDEFVYLDVQKTGSTTIKEFFRDFARSNVVAREKHRPVKERKPEKFYIISCRDPLKQYLSLYSFGVDGKGGLRKRLRNADAPNFYDGTLDGFSSWLDLLLDPIESQKHLSDIDNNRILDLVGLQTLRFLFLALPSPLPLFDLMQNRDDIRDRIRTDALYTVLLRTESLMDDLGSLLIGSHSDVFVEHERAKDFLNLGTRRNPSTKLGIDLKALSPELKKRVQEREWFYFEELEYQLYI